MKIQLPFLSKERKTKTKTKTKNENLTKINLAIIGQARFNKHFDLPFLQTLTEYFLSRPLLLHKLPQRKRPRHLHPLHSVATGRRRIQRLQQPNLPILIPLLLQRRFTCPRPRHGRRSEGQESRLANRERLNLGSLGVTVLELEGGAGEEVGDAGIADDDGAAGVGGDDAVLDGLVVVGAAVWGFEGGVGLGIGRFRRGSLGFFERRRVFGNGNRWSRRRRRRGGVFCKFGVV